MDLLTFISVLIQSLAWPVTVVVVVTLLRNDLSQLLSNVRKFRHKDTEIDFAKTVREVGNEIGSYSDSQKLIGEPDELALLSPRGSILESWIRIENALMDFNQRRGLSFSDKKYGVGVNRKNILQILDHEVLQKSSIKALRKLRELRNEAVHMTDSSISPTVANEYSYMANQLVLEIENA